MKLRTVRALAAFTIVETMIATSLLAAVGYAGYSIMSSSTVLLARNVSLNNSANTLRVSLDRIASEINQALNTNTLPSLCNADSSAYTGTGSAAGIVFDSYASGPYVVNDGATSIATNATTFTLRVSKNSIVNVPAAKITDPPAPQVNDVVILQSYATLRPKITAVSATTSGNFNVYTVTVSPSFSSAVTWASGVSETAYLVHREAVIVVPNNGRNELRLYPDAESLTSTNYTDKTRFILLTSDIGQNSGDQTPFSVNGNMVNIAMRINDSLYYNYLATRQAKQFNTFVKINTVLSPRNTQ